MLDGMAGFGDSNYMEVRCTAALHNLDGVLAMTQLAHASTPAGLLSFPFLNHTIHLLRRHNGLWFFADDVAAAIKCRTTAVLLSKLNKEEVRAMPLGGGEVVCRLETGVATQTISNLGGYSVRRPAMQVTALPPIHTSSPTCSTSMRPARPMLKPWLTR